MAFEPVPCSMLDRLHFHFARVRIVAFAMTIAWSCCGSFAVAQTPAANSTAVPGAPHLLPQDTLLYLRFDDADEFREELKTSSLGRMLDDPKLKPFATGLYATFSDVFDSVGSSLGITLDELLAIPTGQVAVAMFPKTVSQEELDRIEADKDESEEAIRRRIDQKRRAQTGFAGMFIIEAGENLDELRTLVDQLLEGPIRSGYVRREEAVSDVTLYRLVPPRAGRPEIEYFEKDGCFVLGIGNQTAADALDRWLERSQEPTFAKNSDFAGVMGRSLGAEDSRPQITFYADPYKLAERIARRSTTAALVWPIVEDLGVGKIRGVGGSVFRGGEVFDDITHIHLLIDPPRDGLLGVLRPEKVDTMPPSFVPSDITSYISVQWDVETTFDNLGKVIDRFQGEGAFKRETEDKFKAMMGSELRADVIQNLTGRYVGVRWLEPPVKINSQTRLFAFELVDPTKGQVTLDAIVTKTMPEFVSEGLGTSKLYTGGRGEREMPKQLRQPEPCVMILGKWLIISDSRQLMERVVKAEGDSLPRLANLPDYDLVLSELGGKLDGDKPFMVSYVRGAEFIRQMYQMADSEDSRSVLRSAAENNPIAAKFYELMRSNKLPPFEEFEKYFAPSGSFAYDEATGIHFGSFTLVADEE